MVHIVGWGHTPFGKLDALTLEDMIRDETEHKEQTERILRDWSMAAA